MTDMQLQGLTKFEQDLLKTATETLPKESKKVMRKIGSKARTQVARHGRATVDKHTGNYHKSFKRGKPFVDDEGKTVVRVYNNAPHGHLIEYGHRIISHGEEVGFAEGKNVVADGIEKFDNSGTYEKMVSDWLDEQLDKENL